MKWSKYKKVPNLVAELEKGKKYKLVDSTAITSALFSFLYDKPEGGLPNVLNCYPKIVKEQLDGATFKKPAVEVQNAYFLMYQHSGPNKDTKGIVEERKWRKWVDDSLVHVLSPNVYRTPSEALQVSNILWVQLTFSRYDKLYTQEMSIGGVECSVNFLRSRCIHKM